MSFKPKNAGEAEVNDCEEASWLTASFKRRKILRSASVAAEAQRYFQEAVADAKECPLQYWKSKKVFPSLAAMARAVLDVPSTSASSERAFSRGKLIIDQSIPVFRQKKSSR